MNCFAFSENPKCDLPERVIRHNFWISGSDPPPPPHSPANLFECERNSSEIYICVALPEGKVTVRSLLD